MRVAVNVRRLRTGLIAACVVIFSAALLVEPPICSRRDNMPPQTMSIKKEEWISQQRQVLESIKNDKFEKASKLVFEFLRSNAPKEAKFAVVDAFAAKYDEKALGEIYQRTFFEFGFDFSKDLDAIAKKKPNTLSYMQSLAYGFAYFGYDGFRAAVRLAASQTLAIFPIGGDGTPLSAPIALMACVKLAREGKLDINKATRHITEYLTKGDLSLAGKGTLLNMLRTIDPSALEKLLTNPNIDSQTRELVVGMMKTPTR